MSAWSIEDIEDGRDSEPVVRTQQPVPLEQCFAMLERLCSVLPRGTAPRNTAIKRVLFSNS
jgi:hypothetical protein